MGALKHHQWQVSQLSTQETILASKTTFNTGSFNFNNICCQTHTASTHSLATLKHINQEAADIPNANTSLSLMPGLKMHGTHMPHAMPNA
jgi:hypothetical protein